MANSKPRALTTKHLCIAAAAPLSDAAELWRAPQEITRSRQRQREQERGSDGFSR